jgi:hypothetical protein
MYESNGPDLKIRGNASHIAEKYLQLARDAQSSGDPIAAENYYQHAEHYFRLIAAAQEHFRQTQPSFYQQQPQQGGNDSDDSFDDGDNDQPPMSGEPFAPQQQPYYQREQQPQQHQQPQQPQPQHHQQPQQYPQPQQQPHYQPRQQHFQPTNDEDVERLPSFITGGQPQPSPQQGQGPQGPNGPNGPNGQQGGQNGYDGSPDRFPLHRRRRRHRGPRDHSMSNEGDAPMPPGGPQIED